MTFLWITIGVLTAGVLAVLLVPLARERQSQSARADYDLAVYKDQLKEIERDQERGLISEADAQSAMLEIQRRMLALSAESEKSDEAAQSTNRSMMIVIIAIVIPTGAVIMYGLLGSPTTPDFPFAARQVQSQTHAKTEGQTQDKKSVAGTNMEALLDRLAERLARQPNDQQGWRLLAQSAMTVGRYGQAAEAFRRVIALGDNDPVLAVGYAEALTAAAKGVVPSEAQKIFADAVSQNPLNAKARYYLALTKAQKGNLRDALQDWVDLKALSPTDASWYKLVVEQRDRAARELGVDPATVKPSDAVIALRKTLKKPKRPASAQPSVRPSPQPSQQPRGPSAEDVKAASQMSAQDRAAFIRSMVERLADRLKENPDDIQGWQRLARAYDVLGDKEKAREARARIKALQNR